MTTMMKFEKLVCYHRLRTSEHGRRRTDTVCGCALSVWAHRYDYMTSTRDSSTATRLVHETPPLLHETPLRWGWRCAAYCSYRVTTEDPTTEAGGHITSITPPQL